MTIYETYYKFSTRPFQLSPDPRFFFSSRTHKRALAYLRYGIEQGEGFIIITGEVGTGKTTLAARLFQTLQAENVVAAKLVNTQLQAEDLLRMVAAEYGLPYLRVTKAAILRSLELYFRSCVDEGKRVLLVVDEAQNLSRRAIEELRMLSNFQWKGKPMLQSFLLGQREFRNTMRSEGFEQLRQRVIAAYHLKPLDADETREYIEHRLKLAGWRGDPHIADVVFKNIFEFTQGIPRKTNLLCDRLFLYGCLEELHEFTGETLQAVLQDVRQELWKDPTVEGLQALPATNAKLPASEIAGPVMEEYRNDGAPADTKPKTRATDTLKDQDRRLTDVEQSMRSLTDALREELVQLREAILKSTKG